MTVRASLADRIPVVAMSGFVVALVMLLVAGVIDGSIEFSPVVGLAVVLSALTLAAWFGRVAVRSWRSGVTVGPAMVRIADTRGVTTVPTADAVAFELDPASRLCVLRLRDGSTARCNTIGYGAGGPASLRRGTERRVARLNEALQSISAP